MRIFSLKSHYSVQRALDGSYYCRGLILCGMFLSRRLSIIVQYFIWFVGYAQWNVQWYLCCLCGHCFIHVLKNGHESSLEQRGVQTKPRIQTENLMKGLMVTESLTTLFIYLFYYNNNYYLFYFICASLVQSSSWWETQGSYPLKSLKKYWHARSSQSALVHYATFFSHWNYFWRPEIR